MPVAPPPEAGMPDAIEGASCSSTQDCLAYPSGRFSICRKRDHRCTSLLSRDCGTVLGDYKSDDAIIAGALVPSIGAHRSTGFSIQNALRLASEDFARGLPPAEAGGVRRRLALVVCDESEDASRAARHLVSELDVTAILGATYTGATLAVAESVTNPARVLLLTPSSTGELASVTPPGLVRRTCPSDQVQARAMALVVKQILEPRIVTLPGGKLRVAIVHKTDAYGAALEKWLRGVLVFNGALAEDASNQPYFVDVDYGNPDDPGAGDPTVKYSAAIAAVTPATGAPDLVIVIGTTEIATIVKGIEDSWRAPQRPAYLVSSGGEVPELLAYLGANETVRTRVLGTSPGADAGSMALHELLVRYSQTISDGISNPNVFGVANAYDAYYALAYATVALGSTPPTGTALLGALAKLAVSGAPVVDVGPAALQPGVAGDADVFALLAGSGIDLNGTSGPLAFDARRDDVPSDVQVWCAMKSGTTATFNPSGAAYHVTNDTLVGAIANGCTQ